MSCDIHLRAISPETPQRSIKLAWNITNLKFHLNLPGANELNTVVSCHHNRSNQFAASHISTWDCLHTHVSFNNCGFSAGQSASEDEFSRIFTDDYIDWFIQVVSFMTNIWRILQDLIHLWPTDTILGHRCRSTLAQVKAWCLMSPIHYLNQCWLIISNVQKHSSEGNFTRNTSAISQ